MGSQSNVEATNQFFTFTSSAPLTNYDIAGSNTSSAQGYRQNREGNLDTKWETSETTNLGLDATLFNGKLDFSVDVYKKDTKDLLVDQFLNGLEPQLTKPRVNIGTMRNTGVDVILNYHGAAGREFTYDLGVTFSHYKNQKIESINWEIWQKMVKYFGVPGHEIFDVLLDDEDSN